MADSRRFSWPAEPQGSQALIILSDFFTNWWQWRISASFWLGPVLAQPQSGRIVGA
jgi:hypothetical protein